MDLFDTIPDNFFALLTGKNKRLYLACLLEAFKVYEFGSIMGIDKKLVADELTHYIDLNPTNYEVESLEEESDEDMIEAKSNSKALAYFVLRKFEYYGWIYTDVTGDYEEILNFTDAGITMCETLSHMAPPVYLDGENEILEYNPNEYNGYIFTIYSLLQNANGNVDYALIMNEVYRNTKMLIRSLRKLDSRLKDYISSVVDQTEIKDLISKLMDYKVELVDNGYAKLKTGDNINKYRLPIVTKLYDFENSEEIMNQITDEYQKHLPSKKDAYKRAYKNIDEMIDIFNDLDTFISEIDSKNKKYIDSTIGKIKFLLSEDDNTIGKLEAILKYIKVMNSKNKVDKAINDMQDLISLRYNRIYRQESSLYTPRGKYQRVDNQMLDLSRFEFDDDAKALVESFNNNYSDEAVLDYINANMISGKLYASKVINYNSSDEDILMAIYSLIYACEHNYKVHKLDNYISHYKFNMFDFLIETEEK